MSQNKNIRSFIVILFIAINTLGYSQTVGPWNLGELYNVPEWEVTTLAPKAGVTSILFSSIDYLGNPVEVFAYYSAPQTGDMPVGGWPAVLHVHGGGGTANSSWVQSWNNRGYAAISMDLEGHYPLRDEENNYYSTPNPGPSRNGNWGDWELDIEEQWYYHAVSQIILSHSLIASFDEVNADKIGIIGVSWGGLLTSTTMGVDNRLKFAIPVYGAGFVTEADSYLGISNTAKEAFVRNNYDGRTYFDNVTFPTFWINGTNDVHFPMTMTNQSANDMQVPAKIRYEVRMSHGETTAMSLDEVYTFADHALTVGDGLTNFETPTSDGTNVSVNFSSNYSISSAQLCYTLDEDTWYDRYWNTTAATVSGTTISVAIPSGATNIYFKATDSRGLMTTSEYIELDDEPIATGNPNIAVYGVATQSSTTYDGEASRAIDQNTDGVYANGSVTNTAAETNAWWQVALDGSHSIDTIVIYNRTDAAYMSRLTNFTVSVINSSDEVTFSQSFTSFPNPSVIIKAGGATGSIIKVQLNATNTTLNLAEVEVYEVGGTAVSVTGVSVSPESTSLTVGNTLLLTTTISPTSATDHNVSWSSSNTSVATVDEETGLVTAKSVGAATITATTRDGEFTSNCLLTVSNASTQTNNWSKQKYGVFVHYGYGGTGEYGCQITPYINGVYPQNVDETADNFDVQGFVNDIDAMSPEYLIFTAWHCGMYPLYPSAKMDEWLGEGHCSKRDVLQELLDACDAKGIDVYFYIQPSEAHDFSPTEQAAVGYVNRYTKTTIYNNFINEVIAELTERYKTQFKGYWFDKGLSYGCTDRPRIGETVRAIMPNAALIANTYANESADYGSVETKLPNHTFEVLGGYPNVENYGEETWPAYERSVSFVEDRSWAAEPGNIRYTSLQMYKYNVLQAGVNEEGGGVSWAYGPYPTTPISYNNGLLSAMTGLGTLIDEVGESIKNTVSSNSWPTAEGTRIQELTWGIATRSADGNYEYLHVLKAPSGQTLTIPAPADGKEYTAAINLRTGNVCEISQTANELTITLNPSDSWDAVDAVFRLSSDIVTSSSDNAFSERKSEIAIFPNPVTDIISFNRKPQRVEIYDVNGKLLKHDTSGESTINISDLETGMYIVEILGDNGEFYIKSIYKN